ncbi:MAG: sugar phosphate isomerase/epimerase [Caldilineaceae bacterium]|nr:sugar phosphate isomerase/epimerase [Caldilineaceae bacterium]
MLSITTDYVTSLGDPEPYLRQIAEAGFTHIHWCHQWNTDFLYADAEIEQIGQWLRSYSLTLLDVHASEGQEKFWYSPKEYARLAGVELVKNRIDFAARLGGDAIVMHAYPPTVDPALAPFNEAALVQLRKSLDELQPYARARGVRIALENLIDFAGVRADAVTPAAADDNFDLIETLFAQYPPDYLGLCYDSGHANIGRNRLERLAAVKDRLCVLHLHDNDGESDLHQLIFQGVIDWQRTAALIAASPYAKPISMEVSIRQSGISKEAEFLHHAHETGARFAEIVDALRHRE